MDANQSLAGLTARVVAALDDFLAIQGQTWCWSGDTTTSFCAALSAFYRHIPIGHVEAGLRTGNLEDPWPEEANRQLTARLAVLHFAPTETGRRNLLREGVPPGRIFVTGNTVVDAILLALKHIVPGLPLARVVGAEREAGDSPMVITTGHRRELAAGSAPICSAVADWRAVPRHPFRRTSTPQPECRDDPRILGLLEHRNVHRLERCYLAFVALMDRSALQFLPIRGGIGGSARFGKPVLVMRDTTERPKPPRQARQGS
jgi:UDP-N-acetylglucosamine 2-epimerase (non-hydrolysing)